VTCGKVFTICYSWYSTLTWVRSGAVATMEMVGQIAIIFLIFSPRHVEYERSHQYSELAKQKPLFWAPPRKHWDIGGVVQFVLPGKQKVARCFCPLTLQ
jgi:hypothetical protein